MDPWLAVFVLPIALALILGASALSVGDAELEADGMDADFDAAGFELELELETELDVDGDVDGDGAEPSSMDTTQAARRRAPMGVLLSVALLTFGVTGVVTLPLGPALALSAALLSAIVFSAGASRVVGRYLPTAETYASRASDLLGCRGKVRVVLNGDECIAQVHDDNGDLHEVRCRVQDVRAGEALVLVMYEDGIYDASVLPSDVAA